MRPWVPVERRLQSCIVHAVTTGDGARMRALLPVVDAYLEHIDRVSSLAPDVVAPREAVATRLEMRQILDMLLLSAPFDAETSSALSALRDRQPELFPGLAERRFSSYWVFQDEERFRRLLAPLASRPHVELLELGSHEGASACWFLENVLTHPTSRITCVDFFAAPYDERFDHNIRMTGAVERVTKCKGAIELVVRQLPVSAFDVVYVDSYEGEARGLEHAVLAWRAAKPGALVIFDDYGAPADFAPGITRMMDAFLVAHRGEAQVVEKGYQLVLRKSAA